ncbi:hypothetical protein DENIS_0730 [Desulfonema ishimotonii]|uniref:Molybdopterin oxidoreductase n=1 Tax=Desulfonema ishimotonii TaxID=45657 RepID=A0A401FS43_9BACT|nr:hypothetical protein [Desulfonema ishimotonii]GBC59789.1 hypothetical protein DENIS_0730 [Desulfonema ishimotonii]
MTSKQINASMIRTRPLFAIFAVLILAGLAAFLLLLSFRQYHRAWQIYLVNFLFWSAVAQGGLLFSMIMHVTKAKWSGALQNLSEAFVAFFPISLILFLLLFTGKNYVFPWIGQDLHGKEVWLNIPFLFSRDFAGLLILYGFGFIYVFYALKSKIRSGGGIIRKIMAWSRADHETCRARMTTFAVLYMITYAVVLSLISTDLMMSMTPHFVSTLFGGYFFIKAFFIGLGGLIILASATSLAFEENTLLRTAHFHDIGKLFFAFCIVWAYFLYAQVMVIWYGNIPEETHYLIERFHHSAWKLILILAFVLSFIIPFFTLISRKAKTKPLLMLVLCTLALLGIWLENLLLIGPALRFDTAAPVLRVFDVLISLGFPGLMACAVAGLLKSFPELFLKTEEKVN